MRTLRYILYFPPMLTLFVVGVTAGLFTCDRLEDACANLFMQFRAKAEGKV